MTRLIATAIVLFACAAMPCVAQNNDDINPAAKAMARAARLPAYDIVSIHQTKGINEDSSCDTTNDGIVIRNASMMEILEFAYSIASFDLISGVSGPVASARFDITAKIANLDGERTMKLTDDDFQAMTIPLLADRFHLRVRMVAKKMTLYEVVVAKGGPKFTLSAQPVGPYTLRASWGKDNTLGFRNASMPTLAGVLSDSGLHRLVVDRTGLKGNGDFTLKWSSEEAEELGGKNLISIYTAIQEQLGLRLQPAKFSVDTIVVDHAEMPTEN